MQNDLLWKNKLYICQMPGWQEGHYQILTEIPGSKNKQNKNIHIKLGMTTPVKYMCSFRQAGNNSYDGLDTDY